MKEQEKVILKKVSLTEQYDLLLEVFSPTQNKTIKWLTKKTDYNFNGMDIEESMVQLRDAWSKHLNKPINVRYEESDLSSISNPITEEKNIQHEFEDVDYSDTEFDLSQLVKENEASFEKNIERLNQTFQKIEQQFKETEESYKSSSKNTKFFF